MVSLQKQNGKIHIEVQDNGSGFKEEILPFIFERFYKGEKSHTRNGSGAGLGLSISKSLTLALGGKISARNAENGGAIIELIF
ncbi:sensor histidine kinase [Treponema berlinense]|uniref:sensor histidine kinase n=1 Tax=Treponema berlinense TaxID=225004 RepID=UPI002353481D|nr:sensor histidine kinase [Treponema berlinense]